MCGRSTRRTNQAARVSISRRGAPAANGRRAPDTHRGLYRAGAVAGRQEGRVVVRGEVFAASAQGRRRRRAHQPRRHDNEFGVTWSPDSRTLVYASDREGAAHLFLYDFATTAETRLTSGADADHSPRVLARRQARGVRPRRPRAARARSRARKQERAVAHGVFDRPPFAGDAAVGVVARQPMARVSHHRHQGLHQRARSRRSTAPRSRPISFLANSFANTVSWSRTARPCASIARPAHRAAADRAHRSAAAHAAVPRRPVSRSLPRGAGAAIATGAHAAPGAAQARDE